MIRKTFTVSLLVALLFVDSAVGGQKIEIAKMQSGKFQLRVSDSFFFLEANEAPLAEIFREIAKQAKIVFDTTVGPEEAMTISLDRVPLEEGIKQLAKNVSIFYAEDPHNKTHRIARVVVLSDGKEGAFGRAQASSKPAKLNEPPPEPFKFEFDPGKSGEKQRLRK
jgi:hypothetical protein